MPPSSGIEVELPGTDVSGPESYLQSLPAELIQQIAEYVSEDLVMATARDLLYLSLTCTRVFPIAIELLYKFNERMVNIQACGAKGGVLFCDMHRGFHLPALGWACKRGCRGTVEAVIAITPKLCNSSHVCSAIESKQYEIARLLLTQKMVINELKAGIERDSPIFAAVASGDQQLIDRIIEIQGVNFETTDRRGMSVLDHACRMGHRELARRFLDEGANPYLHANSSLQHAIACRDTKAGCAIVREIVTMKPQVRFVSNENKYAVSGDRLDVLEIFLKRGAIDQAFEGAPGHLGDIFEEAISHGPMAVYRKLLSIYPTGLLTERFILDTLTLISVQGDTAKAKEQAQRLIDHVRPIRNNDLSFLTYENVQPALSNCIDYDNVMLADYILGLSGGLRLGQIPLCRPWRGMSEGPRSIEMLKMLREHGFDINQIANRETMLQRTIVEIARDGWNEVLQYLASEVENINQYNEYNATALHTWLRSLKYALFSEEVQILQFTAHLLDEGASLSIGNARGNTALHVAAVNTVHASVIQLLLDRGADTNARNNAGETPLQYAMRLQGLKKTSRKALSKVQKTLPLLAEWTWVLSIPPVRELLDEMNSST
ncbi:unnamed protein product [Clonostachys solani]|uniref:Uncharacterized protein n=1 Tax=Clonostachys solani TaxID=160281 RepID=A0A9P0ERE8_9HYPO|nr:unnamed protein product [Clonostachys solani]